MITFIAALDTHILMTYKQLKKARLDGDYLQIVRCMSRIDQLLDQRAVIGNNEDGRDRRAIGNCG